MNSFGLITPTSFREASEAERTLVYVPGFGDNEPNEKRQGVLHDWANACNANGVGLLRSQRREISMLSTPNQVQAVIADCRAFLDNVSGEFVFLANSFGSGMALSLADSFASRTKATLLITPATGDFEAVTKRVLEYAMGCNEERAERIWGRFDESNRAGLSLGGKDLSRTEQFYLKGDEIVDIPSDRQPNQQVIDNQHGAHFYWENSAQLVKTVKELLQAL